MITTHSLIGGLLLLCLTGFYSPQPDILHQEISVNFQDATLAEVLAELRDRYDLKFAYLNNELPEDQYFTLNFQEAPLREVLDVVLENTSLTYQVMNGQIVLAKKPKQVKRPASEKEASTKPSPPPTQPSASANSGPISSASGPTASTDIAVLSEQLPREDQAITEDKEVLIESDKTPQIQPAPKVEAQPYAEDPVTTTKDLSEPSDKDALLPGTEPDATKESSSENATKSFEQTPSVSGKISEAIEEGLDDAIFNHLPDESPYEESPFHIGIVYPISSNGTRAGQYVNRFSLHLLVGYAAGLDGLEASALGNVENDFVDGAQFAGMFNVVKNRVHGLQAAGFLNLSGGTLEGAQFAGFLNTHAGSVEGVQGAGFLNLSTGPTRGGQFAGFSNITTQKADVMQASGFANIATSDLKGAQFAGFGNYAYQVKGAQFAGFANVAAGHVHGFQGSGFINLARTVKGVQLGLFNVADSIDGVPIGFLSIVRKNGYRTIEVWGGETLHANVALKIGVRNFYNIFSFGSQFTDAGFCYGLGYGIGHVTTLAPTVDFSIDLLAQQIYEDKNPIFENNQRLNLLNTLRLGFSKQFSQHFGLFVAPTFNVFISEVEGEDGSIGSDLEAPYTFFDRTYNGQTRLQMWAGAHVGLRF